MAQVRDSDEHGDGIIALVKETADGLGQLVADHIKLARLEMTADARGYVRDLGTLFTGALVLAIGYGLACIAAGTALARVMGAPLAFAVLGVVHIVIGLFVLAAALRKMKRAQLMHGTKQEVSRSVGILSGRALAVRSH